MKKIYDAIVIGTGAAGYSVADWLYKFGHKDIAILTEDKYSGTSRNTGSDKQTYYKLSIDGKTADSPYNMAKSIMGLGSCDGIKAYNDSVNSLRCFYRLLEYGVNFPTDEHGGFPGYVTDHDNTKRATSCGPLTSKILTEKLEHQVLNVNKTCLLNNKQVVKILVKDEKAFGIICYNKVNNDFESFFAQNIIVATGAPSCVYKQSVYPESQHGMMGVLANTGVDFCNISEWQYGIASTDFRWNVSGSFMQVIPRFVSINKNGTETEFLPDYFESYEEAYNNVFLKGYQWPFSYDRRNGSSRIDIAVQTEINNGNIVYLDFTKNPINFNFEKLSEEAKNYLNSAEAYDDSPIKRLEKLNKKSINLYKKHNIDLHKEKLKIAVCAQHHNGGVNINENYESKIKGLYVIGEAAGAFGITRPGGSALNNTQVSGLMCAKSIRTNNKFDIYNNLAESFCEEYRSLANKIDFDEEIDYDYIRKQMSSYASFIRDKQKCEDLLNQVDKLILNMPLISKSISQYFYDYDMLISAKTILTGIILTGENVGSRGGSIFVDEGNIQKENTKYRKYLSILENCKIHFDIVRSIPNTECNFEKCLSQINIK